MFLTMFPANIHHAWRRPGYLPSPPAPWAMLATFFLHQNDFLLYNKRHWEAPMSAYSFWETGEAVLDDDQDEVEDDA